MALKLTKDENSVRDDLVAGLEIAGAALQQAIATYNDELEKAREWREDLAFRLNDELSERSEKWLESEKGEAAQSWISELENIELDAIDEVDLTARDELEDVKDKPDAS